MSRRDDYPHGVPCWVTALAADVPAALAFYGGLFGWTFDHSVEEGYAVALLRGREVAGIGSLAAAGPEATASWQTNVRVDSAAATADAATAAGGTVLAGPLDLDPAGRLTVIADPAGAVVCAWEAIGRRGAELVNEPSAWAMSALRTPDPERSAAFYGALFGWETEPFGPMTLFRLPGYVGGEPAQPVPRDVIAAMAPADGTPAWGVDFWTADAAAAATTASALGGSVLAAPAEAGMFLQATLADPEGAAFVVSELRLG